ncbi:zinc finger BED domain-containing protein 5-like [Diabrotica undecimpunctata]|uniref:zinc finger BED domain-containing protein 5-like n=1 Tax=Diabrotica undecimpunctata TaxID=50387 RepID=UPI003B639361
MVNQIALSRNTVMRRIDDMGQDVETQIIAGLRKCKYFSLALDESCDITGNAQLSIFVRFVTDSFDVVEELLDLRQLVSTTGQDVLDQVKNVIEGSKVEWSKLESVCTDGAPSMVGRIKGFATLLENFLGRNVFKFHCIIHQEALCPKDLDLSSVIEPVSRCINKIHARASNRRRFRELFLEETEEAGELLVYCSVRWLSKENALARFWNLKECVLQFLNENEELPNECSLLKNEDWLWDLAFLADLMGHLNIITLLLQGKYCIFQP